MIATHGTILDEIPDPRFEVSTLRAAKNIILMPENRMTTEQRWEDETKFLANTIRPFLKDVDFPLWLDFGCGIGRLPAALKTGFLGVENSSRMRTNATINVPGQEFGVVSPYILYKLAQSGFRADGAIALWTLQHVQDLKGAIELLGTALKPEAPLVVLNTDRRWVPISNNQWHDDGLRVKDELLGHFKHEQDLPFDPVIEAEGRFFALYRRVS